MASAKPRKLDCPSCGGTLEAAGYVDEYTCPYCGSRCAIELDTDTVHARVRLRELENDVIRDKLSHAHQERMQESEHAHKQKMAFGAAEIEAEKNKSDNRTVLALLAILVLMIVVGSLSLSWGKLTAPFTGYIPAPASYEDFEDIKLADAQNRFEDAGFTNISTEGLGDIKGFDIFGSKGKVDHVTINGDEDFSTYDTFPPDAQVRIYYHSGKEK